MDWREAIEAYVSHIKVQFSHDYYKENKSKTGLLLTYVEAEGIPLKEFSPRHLDKYLAHRMERNITKRTIETDAQRTKLFFRWLHVQGYIERDPLDRYKCPRAPRAFVPVPDADYLSKLLAAIRDRNDVRRNPSCRGMTARKRRFLRCRDESLLMGLIQTGCRVTELCQLLIEDVDFDRKQISFRRTKGQEPRTVPVSDTWLCSVREWMKIRPHVPDCKTLYLSDIGTPMTRDSVRHQQEQYERFAGLPHYTRHSIRHYTITAMVAQNPRSAQMLAGHKRIETTMLYDHSTIEQVRTDLEAAAPLRKVMSIQPKRRSKII